MVDILDGILDHFWRSRKLKVASNKEKEWGEPQRCKGRDGVFSAGGSRPASEKKPAEASYKRIR
jgi:hypothetical protein